MITLVISRVVTIRLPSTSSAHSSSSCCHCNETSGVSTASESAGTGRNGRIGSA